MGWHGDDSIHHRSYNIQVARLKLLYDTLNLITVYECSVGPFLQQKID